jgi:peptide deformylase
MALRRLRVDDDAILRKTSREVERIDDRLRQLVDDMFDTMYENDGVGLAAPQIGILKRIIVIDTGNDPVVLINPVIIRRDGSKTEIEGCLSVTRVVGKVERPSDVTVKGLDLDLNEVTYEAKDMFARAVCHETDHLDGVLFIDRATEIIDKKEYKGDK